jgi:hypothetical protein
MVNDLKKFGNVRHQDERTQLVVCVFEQQVGWMSSDCRLQIADLYLGTPAALDRYPRGVAGYVAHPVRSMQISENPKDTVISAEKSWGQR